MKWPWGVVVAATVQLLLTFAFVITGALAGLRGPAAEDAAEAEVARQGLPADVLARNGVSFEEPPLFSVLPMVIGLILALLGAQPGGEPSRS